MKKRLANVDIIEFKELDRLVLDEFDAVEKSLSKDDDYGSWGRRNERRQEKSPAEKLKKGEPLTGRTGPAGYGNEKVKSDRSCKEADPQEKIQGVCRGEEKGEGKTDDFFFEGEGDQTDKAAFLTKEEENFVSSAVDWLGPRENKDAIIARIWSLLTESEPDAFYTPQSNDADKEDEPADAAAGNKTKTEAGPIQSG